MVNAFPEAPRSLRQAWPEVKQRLQKHRHWLLMLDFDGTLAPLVRRRDRARMPDRTRRLLSRLQKDPHIRMAVVSGRRLQDLQRLVRLSGIIYAGNHGGEFVGLRSKGADSRALLRRKRMKRLSGQLGLMIKTVDGAELEYKGDTISIHWRGVAPRLHKKLSALEMEVRREARRSGAVFLSGHKVWDLQPDRFINKGAAVQRLLQTERRRDVLAIYAGDDRTDEDAFRRLGSRGLTIRVGRRPHTAAQYRVASPAGVAQFLEKLAAIHWQNT